MPTRITSHRGKLDLFVTVDGQELPIYDLQYVGGEPSAWIACDTGKTYHVHLACKGYPSSKEFRKMTSSLNAELRLDGVLVEEMSSVGPNYPLWNWREQEDMKDIVWKGTYTRPGYKKPFIFQAPQFQEKTSNPIDREKYQGLGSIQVQVRRIQVIPSRRSDRQWSNKLAERDSFSRVKLRTEVPEDAKKGVLSSLTELGQPEPTIPTVMYDVVGENPYDKQSPMTTLTLRYATREVLLARGIIPKALSGRGQGQEDDLKRELEYDAKTESAKSETGYSDAEDMPVAIPHPSGKSRCNRNDDGGSTSARQRKRQRQSYGRDVGGYDEEDEDDKEGVRRMIKRLKEAYERDGGRIDLTADDEDT
ncbi:hypothetical protein FFLO_00879 [Filobasidium floriforme]|uniref:DUF7918 domain-containing protein n=1 Tax=Filobasidium floriforme TaxID=5210 RepID=A0A8K0JQR1_9TREE|nr:uncharacterized protein HD553DRAFT_349239 [Filobasidium floriforme]KAG7571206.1 hypothetical protein FFLO_00879 [Filobasidium floriforme]KAH8087045.1 hypothetical protein HD553DRAFT_349239 [Filobasidium floriforme]